MKLRQLELSNLDLKSIVDRRLNEVSEELPVRLQSYIANFEKREQLHMQDVNQKLAMTQEANIRLRD
jgi:hypothetical protein